MLKKINKLANECFDFNTPLTLRESNILFFASLIVIGAVLAALCSMPSPR